jgi:acetyl-CoA synthetase
LFWRRRSGSIGRVPAIIARRPSCGQTASQPSPELARSIMAFCRERVAPYKRIRRLEFADLPKTISGKIRRVELRERERSRRDPARGVTEFREEDFTW